MPFCPKCGKDVLVTDRFCLNCGQTLDRTAWAGAPTGSGPSIQPGSGTPGPKNGWLAAILNFFLPGFGYIYAGIGRDTKLIVFGTLIFLSVAVVFYASLVNGILSTPSTPTTPTASFSPLVYIGILYLILPFALAYDGYNRARLV